mgnify:CR=1 FL=1
MSEIKHSFMKGKMNKDLDERLVPNGEYRDALNIQVSTSEGSDVGTVQNILGNSLVAGQSFIGENAVCVGSIADEKNDKLYYFITQKDLLVNGGFDGNGSGWLNVSQHWDLSNNQAAGLGTGSGYMHSQAPGVVKGNVYTITYDVVVASTAGGIILANHSFIGGINTNGTDNNVSLTNEDTIGTYTLEWEQGPLPTRQDSIWLYTSSNYNGTIDNVSVFRSDLARSCIIEYDSTTNTITPVFVDVVGDVLKFNPDNIITGINIIDDLLLWTDNVTEPKKINITRSKAGTDSSGIIHTDLIVEGAIEGPIKEEHITVIKKSPSLAPETAAVSNPIRYTSGGMKLRAYFYPEGPDVNGVAFEEVQEHHEMWVGLPNDPATGVKPAVNVGDILNIYKGWSTPDPEVDNPIARLMIKEVRDSGTQFEVAQIQNNFDASGLISLSSEIAVKVSVSNLVTHTPSPNNLEPKYHFELEQGGVGIFERKLPRFAYRYKYEDNEYSSVGAFSEVVFVPGKFEYHPIEAYNKGMINNLKELTLKNFVTTDIPDDVVQIDLLYKNEFSPNIYVIKTIDKGSNSWSEGGSYTVTTENVYAQLPSNQLIRPWDNVPKRALAQEVTGNRVVYGNYFQNYNLEDGVGNKITPNLTASLDRRFFANDEGYGMKSLKSLRTYNFGIIYGDKYGRETPVFTNDKANQLITKSSSTESNAITINISNDAPVWADYYKIFVKETSNEYYNLAMGRMYDAEDGDVWLSFPSIDRNKVDEDTYLVLKKGAGDDGGSAVYEEARYKVVAIENNAPDYIKTTYDLIAEPTLSQHGSGMFGGLAFLVNYPASIPRPGTQTFTLIRNTWEGANPANPTDQQLPDMLEVFNDKKDGELYVSFSNVDKQTGVSFDASPIRMSKKYKVSSVEPIDAGTASTGYHGGSMYRFRITQVIPASEGWLTENVSTGVATSNVLYGGRLKPHFYKKIVENKPEFDGRFFVKIIEDSVIQKYLSTGVSKNEQGWKVDAAINQLYYIADEDAPTITVGTTTPITTDLPTGGGSRVKQDWINNVGSSGKWFIDAAAFAGSQPLNSSHPKDAVVTQNSIDLSDISSSFNYITYNTNYAVAAPLTGFPHVEGQVHFHNEGGVSESGLNGEHWGDEYTTAKGFGWEMERPTSSTPFSTMADFNMQGDKTNWASYNQASPENGNLNADGLYPNSSGGAGTWSKGWVYTKLWMSEIVIENKDKGTKISTGKAFLKGAHYGSYSTNAVTLADLSGDGGYLNVADTTAAGSVADVKNYLHLSYGGIGPSRSADVSNHTLGYSQWQSYKTDFWSNYIWDKNWNVGVPGQNSSTNNQSAIVSSLTSGKLFRLVGDNNIYKIKGVTKRRLYNHQGHYNQAVEYFNPLEIFMLDYTKVRSKNYADFGGEWTYATTGVGGSKFNLTNQILPIDMFDSVKASNILTGSLSYANDTSVYAQHRRMVQQYNCRLSYLIEYEVLDSTVNKLIASDADMAAISDNSQFTTANMNLTSFAQLEFISEFNTNEENLLTLNPAIFETEPKEDVGLDIYYEATGKIPTNVSLPSSKVQNLIHIGATLSITPAATVGGGVTGIFVTSIEWNNNGYWYIKLSSDVHTNDLSGADTVLKFYNDDGTYGTAKWAGSFTGNTDLLKVIINPNTIGLGWFNCWSFGNGVESNRIGDTYNKPYIINGVKASTTLLDSYKEEHRKYGLIYSGIYNSTGGVNDLNQFITAEKITKDVNPSYGSIQKLHSRSSADGDLITLCEDRVLKILANKDALYNADGNPQLIANNNVLGQTIPFSGEFGISTNPESFASESYRVYFTDKVRGAVMRLSRDGLTPISDHGMKDWFRDNLKLSTKLIGSYDDRNDEYNITLADRETLGEELIQDPKVTDNAIWSVSGGNTADFSGGMGALVTSPGTGTNQYPQFYNPNVDLVNGRTYQITVKFSEISNGGDNTTIKAFVYGPSSAGGVNGYRPYYNTNVTNGIHVSTFVFDQSQNNGVPTMRFSIELYNGDDYVKRIRVEHASLKVVVVDPMTVSFKEDVRGWVSFKSFVAENALSVANDYYSTLGGKLYKHHIENTNRNNFYNRQYTSSVNVLLNDLPGTVKTFHALNYEGSQSKVTKYRELIKDGVTYSDQEIYNLTAKEGWFASAIATDKQEGTVTEFIEKEGKWFNYIKGKSLTPLSKYEIITPLKDFGAFDAQGVGIAEDVDVPTAATTSGLVFPSPIKIGFSNKVNASMQVGDIVYSNAQLDPQVPLGVVVSVEDYEIKIELADVNTGPYNGDFIFFSKNKTINTSSLLGYYANVKFENNSTNKVELFSIGSEVSESSK